MPETQPFFPGPLVRPAANTPAEFDALLARERANPWLVHLGVGRYRTWNPRTGDRATVPGWDTVGSYN